MQRRRESPHCRRIPRRPAGYGRDRGRHHDIKHGNLMRRLLATMPTCVPALAPALLAFFMMPISSEVAHSDPSGFDAAAPVTPAALTCTANDIVVYDSDPSSGSEPGCTTAGRTTAEVAEARAYLIDTASPGFTMTLQGAELAIGRLHPEFVVRLANRSAKRAARDCRSRACSRPIDRRHSASAASPTSSTHCTPTNRGRHAWHRQARLARSAVGRDGRQERRRLSLWSARPGR